jgi:putative tryptophan/tyrosine transport system substrate-binding protein
MQFDRLRRREFITLLGGAAAWPLAAHAQPSKNSPRLCFLTFDPATSRSTRFGAFFQGLVDKIPQCSDLLAPP